MYLMPFTNRSIEDIGRIFEVDLIAVLVVTQAFLPLLVDSINGVLVASIGSINQGLWRLYLSAYNAPKAAVEAMGRTLWGKLACHLVHRL